MNSFDIKLSETGDDWIVTAKVDIDAGALCYRKSDQVFTISRSVRDKKHDMEACLYRLLDLQRVAMIDTPSKPDHILAHIYSDKFTPITVYTSSTTRMLPAKKMFRVVAEDTIIKGLARTACMAIAPQYLTHAMDAFVSTIPTDENLYALQDKMSRSSATWKVDPTILKATLAILAVRLDVKNYQMVPTVDPEVAGTLKFNPNAGTGFKHWNIPIARNKRNYAPYMERALFHTLTDLPNYIGRSEDLIPPMIHIYTAKPEVRAFDGEKGKIRLIGMVGQYHDFLSKLVDTPFLLGLQRWEGCLIGSSVWSSLTPLCMKALAVSAFNCYTLEMRNGHKVKDPGDSHCWLTLDLSGQDVSFKPALLFILLMFRYFYISGEVPSVVDVFNELFAFEMASVTAKLVQWFGDMWYIVTGIMTSGYHGTSHIDTLMLVVNTYMSLIELGRANGIHPKTIVESIRLVGYGDDLILRYPAAWNVWMGVNEQGFPTAFADAMLKCGGILKPGETVVFVSEPTHKNKFFTEIKDDEIVSSGVHILQRYFVKYDRNYQPLHPDSRHWWKILPWRKTDAYATRMATDANGFTGKEGRLRQGSMRPLLGAYVKAFGLLCDAGPNYVAHRLIKTFMKEILLIDPSVALDAPNAARDTLGETATKLGAELLDLLPLVSNICRLDDPVSYSHIVAKMGIKSSWLDAKESEWRYRTVGGSDEKKQNSYYVKDGEIHIH